MWIQQLPGGLKPGAQKRKIVFKPIPYCLPKCVILRDISNATKRREVQFKKNWFGWAERH